MEFDDMPIAVPAIVVGKPYVDKKARVIVKVRLRYRRSPYYGAFNAHFKGLDVSALDKGEIYAVVADYDLYHRQAKELRPGDEVEVALDGDGIYGIKKHNWLMRRIALIVH